MDYLYIILNTFRHLFNIQSYTLFCAFILGIMFSNERKTVTGICKATNTRKYWSMIKFLSRSKWNVDALAIALIKLLQSIIKDWVYVYDETHSIKTGKSQFGLHFFPNHKYNLKNKNQSKYHWGHQFAALGILSVSQAILFPVWVKMLIPGDAVLNSLAVLTTIMSNISSGLVIFDRGFNNRKVFKIILDYGHQLLCRAKSNAVFYFPVEHPLEPQKKRGRPRKYGKRMDIAVMSFRQIDFLGQIAEVADAIVYTKMCPQQVRLVVRRTFSEKTKTYKYFCVYTTNLGLSVEKILFYYRLRWEQETAFRDSKQSFGFDDYQVQSETSISRFVQLSFVSMSIMQLFFNQSTLSHSVDEVCEALGIHWYRPSKLTRGLMQAYLRYLSFRELFSCSKVTLFNQTKIYESLLKVA